VGQPEGLGLGRRGQPVLGLRAFHQAIDEAGTVESRRRTRRAVTPSIA
jgi:hypothetical protein